MLTQQRTRQATHPALQQISVTRESDERIALPKGDRTPPAARIKPLDRTAAARAPPPSPVSESAVYALAQRRHFQWPFVSVAVAFVPSMVSDSVALVTASSVELGKVVISGHNRLSGCGRWRLALDACFSLVGFVESVHHPSAALVDVSPAWVVDGDKLQEAVADAVDDHSLDVLLVVEDGLVALEAQLLSLPEAMGVSLAEAAGEEEGVVRKGILFTAEHVHFGKPLENALRCEKWREQVVSGEVGFVLLADVEEDHCS